jgi:hypothetical protein
MDSNATPKSDATQLDTGRHTPNKRPSITEIILSFVFLSENRGLTQPEAYHVCRESCLHFTVSAIQMTHGITIQHEPSSKQNHCGGKPFYRYWIAQGKDQAPALDVLAKMAAKPEASSLVAIYPEFD